MVQLHLGMVVRVLLGMNGVLMIALALENVDSILINGPYLENVFMSFFAALVAWICVWAAFGHQTFAAQR